MDESFWVFDLAELSKVLLFWNN